MPVYLSPQAPCLRNALPRGRSAGVSALRRSACSTASTFRGLRSKFTVAVHDKDVQRQHNVEERAASKKRGQQSSAPPVLFSNAALSLLALDAAPWADGTKASLYATAGLFFLSFPGIWSTVKRSTKSKVAQRTFEIEGPAKEGAEPLDVFARKVTAFFKENNYNIVDAGEVITFEGVIAASNGTAYYLVFCVFVCLLSLGLVLSIYFPDVGNAWYGLTALSPLSGYYYLTKAERKEQVKVKMVTSDDELTTDIILQGDAEEIERFRKTLNVMEKDMIYVKGIFEA